MRKLPTVDILGTTFCVDVQGEELWQKTDRNNRISFNVFYQEGNGYTFLYDTLMKTAPEDKEDIAEMGDRYEWVTLHALMELDPVGIALKYGIPLSVLCPDAADLIVAHEEDDKDFY